MTMTLGFEAVEEKAGNVLSAQQIKAFNENGYLIIPRLYSDLEIEAMKLLRDKSEAQALAKGGSYHRGGAHYDVETLDDETMRLRKVQEVYKSELSYRLVTASNKVLDIVEDLIGPDIYYHSSKLMCKAPGGRRKPWHQDFAYWQDMNTKQVTVWTAVDPSTRENGCMQIIPGSHKRGLIEHYNGEDYMIREEGLDKEDIVFAEMNPGDCLIFNVLALHASDPNTSDKPRLSTIIDFDSQPKPEKAHYGSDTPIR